MKSFDKLKAKLAELFQLDQADLDFGIYRIMNAKREEITRFLEHDLLPQVREAFAQYKSGDKAELQKELEEAIQQAKALGADPETLPKVKELRARLEESVDITALENEVYDHLYNFFSRYYDEGDFISLRRYKEGVYAIPYEGEEVKLYWANHDQYYIKTTEYFRDYAFRMPDGRRVHFKIVEADTEKDNIKAPNGKDRRFVYKELTAEDAEGTEELVFRFEYKVVESREKQAELNKRNIDRMFDDLNALAQNASSESLRLFALSAVKYLSSKAPTEKNPDRTVLEKHLSDYTKRNTFDYFIHKDLGKFLRRELDFYIKNEVMHLDDIENESAPRVEQYLSKIKVIRRIAHKIIDFLAQIEDFQKKLWLKKKFVVETNYCLTLDRVPEEFYPEIAANDAQREEWVRLFAIDELTAEYAEKRREKKQNELFSDSCAPYAVEYTEPLTVEFLKANPYLVLDTRHFSEEFKWRLIAALEDIDGQCDGLLVHSENFQALRLLMEKYRTKVKCVHIDPPYNTQTSGFLYKNDYQHSSWLAMMENRIVAGLALLDSGGSFLCHIDENEYERLHLLFENMPIPNAGTIVWDKRNPMTAGRGVATQHEYVIWRSRTDRPINLRSKNIQLMLTKAQELIKKHGGVTEKAKKEYAEWVTKHPELSGGEKAYRFLDDEGRIYRGVSLRAPEPRTDPKFFKPLIHPVTGKPCAVPPNGFSRTPETLQVMIERGEIIFGPDETTQPQQKRFLSEDSKRQISSVIQDAKRGKADLDALGLENFPYCHSVSFYMELLGAASHDSGDIILDYFAGSGTTGHAVINLNREDGGRRKYILVEMGDYFDTVLMPRIKKVVYSEKWKDGKPLRSSVSSAVENPFNGISHMFKYIRLESYEDTLANIELKRTEEQQRALFSEQYGSGFSASSAVKSFRESYMLKYMLETEAKGSPSLLNIDWFDDPFNYKLLVGTGSVGETKPVKVDLVETFNWLLGLRVRHMDAFYEKETEEKKTLRFVVVDGVNPKGDKVLVIWRKIRDVTAEGAEDTEEIRRQRQKANEELEEFFRKQQYNTLDSEYDIIYVNGDNNLMNIPLEKSPGRPVSQSPSLGEAPRYKVRLIEEEFKRLMFEVRDV